MENLFDLNIFTTTPTPTPTFGEMARGRNVKIE